MRDNSGGCEEEAWPAPNASTVQHLGAECREGTGPIVMTGSETDDRPAGGSGRDQPRLNARSKS